MRTSTDMTPRPRSGMRTAAAQTAFDSGGLHYHWDPFSSGLAFPGMPVGLGFVDPTPIATHVVSADALEGRQEIDESANEILVLITSTHCEGSVKPAHPCRLDRAFAARIHKVWI